MALRAINGLALCAGVGMLDEGARLAFEYLGLEYRTICYVEREVAAAAQLVTLMEAGCLDQAPVWSDLVTFDTRRWRGLVDCITAGFPCQPHSVAGKREGLSDERWIWPDISRLIGELRPRFVLLENVPGLASTGGLDGCIGDLAERGYSAEWARLSAAAVGASHERERLFIFGWLVGLADDHGKGCGEFSGSKLLDGERAAFRHHAHRFDSPVENAARHERDGSRLGDTELSRAHARQEGGGSRDPTGKSGGELGDTSCDGWREGRPELRGQSGRSHSAGPGGAVADSELPERRPPTLARGCGDERDDTERQASGRPRNGDGVLADTSSARPQGREFSGTRDGNGGGSEAHGSALKLHRTFAPGPGDEIWEAYCSLFPHLAPAVESGVCVLADGLALVVDESRTDQLRAIGNGVVALTAACAYVELARRAGIA